uniref:Uncharacterized protein n=1 Tax=Ixodes ricinus TaxID=34613 RepID=A0A6B0V077_IXORI
MHSGSRMRLRSTRPGSSFPLLASLGPPPTGGSALTPERGSPLDVGPASGPRSPGGGCREGRVGRLSGFIGPAWQCSRRSSRPLLSSSRGGGGVGRSPVRGSSPAPRGMMVSSEVFLSSRCSNSGNGKMGRVSLPILSPALTNLRRPSRGLPMRSVTDCLRWKQPLPAWLAWLCTNEDEMMASLREDDR